MSEAEGEGADRARRRNRRARRPLRTYLADGRGTDNPYGIPFPGRKLPREEWTRTRASLGAKGRVFDWLAAFGREAPHVLDLGCGNGRFLISSALARPDHDHLGVELVPQAVQHASLRAGQRGLRNVKFAWGNASELIVERCARASLDEVHLYHPQPYYDARDISRRQLTPQVLLAIFCALRPRGLFVFQTDHPAYAQYAREIAGTLFEWRELPAGWLDAPEGRTLREIEAMHRGLPIARAQGRRRELAEDDAERLAGALPQPLFDADRGQAQ